MPETEPFVGMGYDGENAPPRYGSRTRVFGGQETFSLGCFQWVERSVGRDLKRGPVQHRIKGRCTVDSIRETYREADEFCD